MSAFSRVLPQLSSPKRGEITKGTQLSASQDVLEEQIRPEERAVSHKMFWVPPASTVSSFTMTTPWLYTEVMSGDYLAPESSRHPIENKCLDESLIFSSKWHDRGHPTKVDHECAKIRMAFGRVKRTTVISHFGKGWGPAWYPVRAWCLRQIIQRHAQANFSRPLKDVSVHLTWKFLVQKDLNLKVKGISQRMQCPSENGLKWQLLVWTWEH